MSKNDVNYRFTFNKDRKLVKSDEVCLHLVNVCEGDDEFLRLTRYSNGLWIYYKGDPVWAEREKEWNPTPDTFEKALAHAINCWSKENGSDTPDYILAHHLKRCLENFDTTIQARESWFGRTFGNGKEIVELSVDEKATKTGRASCTNPPIANTPKKSKFKKFKDLVAVYRYFYGKANDIG